jgi:hypothetical protein
MAAPALHPHEAAAPPAEGVFDPAEVADLPPCVRRFFDRVLVAGQRVVASASCTQDGAFLLRAPSFWRPFRATERFETRPAGFRWDASVRTLPGVPIVVHDAFAQGEGSVDATLFGLVHLVQSRGTGAMAVASLQRYLAEAVLLPTALLPREGVAWTPLDDDRARATLAGPGVEASIELTFGPDGFVSTVFVPDRPRDVAGRLVPTPWRGRWWAEVTCDGMHVPSAGEVEWLTPEGPLPYWRARVEDLRFVYR